MNTKTEQIFICVTPSENISADVPPRFIETPVLGPANLENVENFSNVCRTCATVTEFLIPIFEGEGLQRNLAENVNKYLPIQVSPEDTLPVAMCYQCAHALLAWHEVASAAPRADRVLRDTQRRFQQNLREQNPGSIEENQSFENTNDIESPAPARRLLFHCEECRTYVTGNDFVVHMSQHAMEYQATSADPAPAPLVKREALPKPSIPPPAAIPRRAKTEVMTDENENTEASARPPLAPPPPPPPRAPIRSDVATAPAEPRPPPTVDEFLDHSDAEFDPIPESVFEAIEDSRDAGPAPGAGTSTASGEPARHRRERSCPVCHKVYTASSSFFYHVKHAHSTVREHACTVCGRAFGSRMLLRQHSAVHSAERPHACAVCGARFRARAGLYIHQQSHGGPRAHRCATCGRAFRWRTALARHERRHSAAAGGGGGGAHGCPECGRRFAVRGDLLRHRRTHAAAVAPALRCPFVACRGTFAQPRYLRVHLQRRHGCVDGESARGPQPAPDPQQPLPPPTPPPPPTPTPTRPRRARKPPVRD